MLLSYDELVELVKAEVIENCPLDLVNGASIDITLASKIKIETGCGRIDYSNREPLGMEDRLLGAGGYTLEPREFILASSQQIFHLPANIACEYKLKSSMARSGLNHLNAGWADPTWHGSALTLELVNTTRRHSITIRPGDRIGQVVFFRCEPVPLEASYSVRGRYNNHPEVETIKP